MDRVAGDVRLEQVAYHAVGAVLGPGEHERAREGRVLQEPNEHLALARLLHVVDGLLDAIGGGCWRRGVGCWQCGAAAAASEKGPYFFSLAASACLVGRSPFTVLRKVSTFLMPFLEIPGLFRHL